VVSELLEVLQVYGIDNPVIQHPLHPFSRRYFDGSQPALVSYAQHDCDTARQLQPQPVASAQPWWHGRVALEPSTVIAFSELQRFYQQPQRYFLQQHFGVRLPQLNADSDEREPFSIDTLDLYQCHQHWIADSLAGKPPTLEKLLD
jgi:exodeoxyribonuclease V gamma subunit